MALIRAKNQLTSIFYDTKNLILATTQSLLNPSLTVPFFWGPIYSKIPHLRSNSPFGQTNFTAETTDELTSTALTTHNGIATYWAGPFPVLYVASNQARCSLVRETHIGIVDKTSAEFLHWLSSGNHVMSTFPDFQPIDSVTYKIQRQFLLKRFHGGAKERLSEIQKTTTTFLTHYCKEHKGRPRPLRELIIALVLRTSSHLLGLTIVPLDRLYFEKPEYRQAIDRVAQYGISERADPDLEEILYQFFFAH